VLVFHDLLGLGGGPLPKFVRQYADLADTAVAAVEAFFADVQSGDFPGDAETYHMPAESAAILRELKEGTATYPLVGPESDHLLADEAMES